MKTLIMNKIEEREAFIFRRIIHRNEQFKKGLISFESFEAYENAYKAHFVGYVRAFWDIELLTDEEEKVVLEKFNHHLMNL
jgi:hypothetical protein